MHAGFSIKNSPRPVLFLSSSALSFTRLLRLIPYRIDLSRGNMIHELELELEHEQEDYNSRLYHFHGMQQGNTGCHVKSMSVDQLACRSTEAGGPKNKGSSEKQQTGWSVHQGNENGLKLPVPHEDPKTKLPSGKYISRRYYISIRKMVCEKCCR